MITLEKTVHGDMRDFLEKRLDDLAVETKDWHDKAEREIKATEDKVFALREKRGAGLEQRGALRERMQKEEEQRNQVMMEKQRNEQMAQEHSAVLFLQDEGRKYILRIRERLAAKK